MEWQARRWLEMLMVCVWFGGAHALPSLDHVSFDTFVCIRTIFSGVGVCEAWS